MTITKDSTHSLIPYADSDSDDASHNSGMPRRSSYAPLSPKNGQTQLSTGSGRPADINGQSRKDNDTSSTDDASGMEENAWANPTPLGTLTAPTHPFRDLDTPELRRARTERFVQGKFTFSASILVFPSVPAPTPSNIAASSSARRRVIPPPPPAVPMPWGPAIRPGKPKPTVPPIHPTSLSYGSTVTRTLASRQPLPLPLRALRINAIQEQASPTAPDTSPPESEHDVPEDELEDSDVPRARPAYAYKPRGRPPKKTQPTSHKRQRERRNERSYEDRHRVERNKKRAENTARHRREARADPVAYAAYKRHHTEEMRQHRARRKLQDGDEEKEKAPRRRLHKHVEDDIAAESEEEEEEAPRRRLRKHE
ncbi:hypothetical protein BDZ89DRAFT_1149598 [Hymenopellis radicata]|nr:hypothetical protein BDZ89DRAFT_1149598 [Hymenopellis radicata]